MILKFQSPLPGAALAGLTLVFAATSATGQATDTVYGNPTVKTDTTANPDNGNNPDTNPGGNAPLDEGNNAPGGGEAGPDVGGPAAIVTRNGPVQNVTKQPQQKVAGAPAPSFLLTGSVGVSETYTTNVAGTASGNQDDFDSRLNLNLNALERSAELTAALSYAGQLDIFARSNQQPVISTNFTGLLDYNVIPDYLRFDLRAFATPVLISPLGAVSTPNTPQPQGFNGNVSDTYGYQASPTLSFHFGDFATSMLVPSYGTVWFVSPAGAPPPPLVLAGTAPPPQLSTTSVVEQLTSGQDFSRFFWQLTGNYLKESDAALNFRQIQGTGEFDYAISHEFYLLATGGYESLESNVSLSQDISGLIAYGGFRVRFSENSMFEIRAGEEFHSPSYIGSAAVAFSPSTGLTGTLTDSIQTPAGQLLSNLGNLNLNVQNDGGFQFFNGQNVIPGQVPTSLQGFTPTQTNTLGFNNVIERLRTGELSIYHNFPDQRTEVSLGAFGTSQDILSNVPANLRAQQTSWGATLEAARAFSPYLRGSAFVTWADQNISFGRSDYYTAGATATYSISPTLAAYGTAEYSSRVSSSTLSAALPISGSSNVTTFTIGVTKNF